MTDSTNPVSKADELTQPTEPQSIELAEEETERVVGAVSFLKWKI